MQAPSINTNKALFSLKPFTYLCIAIFAVTLYRAWVLLTMNADLSLHFDEAQYWLWSQNLQWGYYSKPPFLAAVIRFFTDLFGNNESAVRSAGLVFYPLTTFVIFTIAKTLTKNDVIGLWSGLIFITMPGVSLSSMLITTDVVLFLWWSLSCLFFYRALQTNELSQWIAVGIFAGFGLLTKYTMGIFAIAAFAWMITVPELRTHFKNPRLWFAASLSLIIFLPNLYWNWQNDWPNIRHTSELSSEGVSGIHPFVALTFLSEQFGVFGLVSFSGYILWIFQTFIGKTKKPNCSHWFLLYFSLTFLFIICIQALQGRAYANWAAPTYAIASIATAYWIVNRHRKIKLALLLTNLLLMMVLYHGDKLYDLLKPNSTQGPDPLKTLRAWHAWGDEIKTALTECNDCSVIVDSRETAAQLMYQLRDTPVTMLYWNPDKSQDNHYEMMYSLQMPQKGDFLLVLKNQVRPSMTRDFDSVAPVKVFSRKGKYKNIRTYHLFRAENFKGYL